MPLPSSARFKDFGLPDAMRTDNGVRSRRPALYGLSKLVVWFAPIRMNAPSPAIEQNGLTSACISP
jgi:hypothetical protein